jgi:hypothetical protein
MNNARFTPRIGYSEGMGKKRPILLAVLIVVAAGGVAWLALRPAEPQEPIYQGKRLSVWLNDYELIGHGWDDADIKKDNEKVDEVVRQIGTNAIPTLFRMLNATDSPLKKLKYLAHDHGIYDIKDTDYPSALAQTFQAELAFRALGAEAKEVVPRLIEIYDRKPPGDDRELVARILGGIGPPASNAVPSLLRTVANGGRIWSSIRALGEIHAEPAKVVPVLKKLLKDADDEVRKESIVALQAFGADARPAVPALVELLTDHLDYVRKHAAQALKVIDPTAATKAGVQ